ncbi:MAG: prepilin-type N-terminal cleavage/methylation domain-containing protein [Myxococcales bacterium]|jgi:general secretion pathway protein G|nr:prepilin-type N-terminal cleavage/methylation domain-containing protein [Myxococcales bacterium]
MHPTPPPVPAPARRPRLRLRPRARRRGVTLIEILIVLAIIGIIAGGVALVAVPQYLKSQITSTHTNAIELHRAAELWRAGHAGECPTPDRLKTDGVIGPTSKTTDAWNRPYSIRCEDAAVTVASAGPDQKEGTTDDIKVPDEHKTEGPLGT